MDLASGPGQITPREVIKEEYEPNQEMLAVGTKTNREEDSVPDCKSTSKPPIRLENPQNRHTRHKQKRIYMRGGEEVHLRQNEPAERRHQCCSWRTNSRDRTNEERTMRNKKKVCESVHHKSVPTHEPTRLKKTKHHAGK
jgi:hypothetical protein